MKVTEIQIQEIKKLLGDKKFNEIINAFNYEPNKIYPYKGVGTDAYYKMHYTNVVYSFIELNSSVCHANGYFQDPSDCLKSLDNVKSFDSIQEAFKSGYFN